MANPTTGHVRILSNRKWWDYKSLKREVIKHPHGYNEVIISGSDVTTAAAAEFNFNDDLVMHYIAAEGSAYIRTAADDANQHSKYVCIEYQDDTGQILYAAADLDGTNSTTEIVIATDFYRLRQMFSEVEANAAGTKEINLTDSEMGGADDNYGFITDGNSAATIQRYFTPDAATYKSYIGRILIRIAYLLEGDATPGSYYFTITYTPKVVDISTTATAQPQVKADITQVINFSEILDWQPCIELEPATEVIFKIHKLVDADHVSCYIEATFIEDRIVQ